MWTNAANTFYQKHKYMNSGIHGKFYPLLLIKKIVGHEISDESKSIHPIVSFIIKVILFPSTLNQPLPQATDFPKQPQSE